MVGETVQGLTGKYPSIYGPWWGSGAHASPVGLIMSPTDSPSGFLSFLPNAPASYDRSDAKGLKPDAGDFSSRHPGGVNVLMADGSVRWIKNSINVYTWVSISTIAGGEIISSDGL
jgi:prepilin-type processing-associated H-X9-DG protein